MPSFTVNFLEHIPVFDTHEHFSTRDSILREGGGLLSVLRRSYVGFHDFYPGLMPRYTSLERYPDAHGEDFASIKRFLDSYDVHEFLSGAATGIRLVHGMDLLRLDERGLEDLNNNIKASHARYGFREQWLDELNIQHVVLDIPHHACGLDGSLRDAFPESRFSVALRLNSFLFGFDPTCWTPETSMMLHARDTFGIIDEYPSTLDCYLADSTQVLDKFRRDIVAFKCASAYERSIDFGQRQDAIEGGKKYRAAARIHGKAFHETSPAERSAYGDVVLHHLLDHVEGWEVPVQFHAGTAITSGSHPANLESLLDGHPGITFAMLHCGYPWTRECVAMAREHDNALLDLSWLPFLSREGTTKVIEAAAGKDLEGKVLAFGGDCGIVEGSAGALQVLKEAMAEAFNELVSSRKIDKANVKAMATDLLHDNASKLFFG